MCGLIFKLTSYKISDTYKFASRNSCVFYDIHVIKALLTYDHILTLLYQGYILLKCSNKIVLESPMQFVRQIQTDK